VTPEDRDDLQESHSHGVAYGHGRGDLDETAKQVLGVEVAVRWLRQT